MNVLRGAGTARLVEGTRGRSAGGPRALARWAEANGADLAALQVRRPSLEDIYLSSTQTRKEVSR